MFNLRGMRKALLVGAAAAGLAGASAAEAGLVLDLQLAGGGKERLVNPGDTVQLQLYGVVTGTDGVDNETLYNVFAVLRSSTGGLLGNFSPGQIVPPYDKGPFTGGVAMDVDGDSDLDIGSTTGAGTPSPVSTFLFARADPTLGPVPGVREGANSERFLLANIQFHVTGGGLETLLNAHRAPVAGLTIAGNYQQDGAAGVTTAAGITSGDPVRLFIPEPTTMGLAAVGALGLLARRRRA